MYYGGLGYADVNTTYLQSPLFDTTDLEASSLDTFFTFQFYCDRAALGTAIALVPKIPLGINGTVPRFLPSSALAAGTGSPKYGCEGLAGEPVTISNLDVLQDGSCI